MFAGIRSSLELRMVILAGTGLLIGFALFAGLSLWAVNEGAARALEERVVLTQTTAERVRHVLQDNLETLQAIAFAAHVSATGSDADLARRALHDAYLQSIFREGVYLLDARGQVVLAEPTDQAANALARRPFVQQALDVGKPIVSDMYRMPSGKPMLSALFPIRDGLGQVVGLLGGDIDPTDQHLQEIVSGVNLGANTFSRLVDSAGNVIVGNGTGEIAGDYERQMISQLVASRSSGSVTCFRCHESATGTQRDREVVVYAPIAETSWSVIIGQPENQVLLPLYRLRQVLLLAGLPLFLISLIVAWGTARSIVRPLAELAKSAESIAGGDLASPVPQAGRDDIGRLAKTFEQMRLRLRQSLDRIQGWNAELEDRVRQRTLQLEEQENVGRELLRKVISAQEEERRRIARELHDETSQSLAALILAVETASIASGEDETATRKLVGIQKLAVQILDGVHKMIYDLRPSLLDDLGLVAALTWYAETRLEAAGINVSIETTGGERRLPREIETTLFRVLQEGISNIAKHACAETALVRLEIRDNLLVADIEDDGQGFDPEVVKPEVGKMQGLGLLGIQERVNLLKGTMVVVSRPGHGARLHFEVPLEAKGEHDEEYSSALS